ncbi:EamA family transporter [Chitinophaga agrisoli]|uniref:EamA family transporter n=1 Tax=Chitinophaga agrisoli TaxID=2607653 RepID=A0A5B2VLF1_9BACT|nr:EamA family transporter [Chitinophaga agrisoli]KAA2239470.1 EamA family transporter [Chitinophaga agrisoli]
MNKSNLTKAYIALMIVSIFWGTTYLAARIGVRHMHGLMLSGLRQSIAGALLVGFFLLRGYKLPSKAILSRLFIIGVLMLVGANGLLTWALTYIPSGLGAIVAATVPIWMTIFSFFLVQQKSRITPLLVAGMVIGLVGVMGIFSDYLTDLVNPSFRFGIMLVLISCLFWSMGSVLTAKWALQVNYLYGAGFEMLFSGIVMLAIMLVTGEVRHAEFTPELWGSLLYLIFFGSILGYSAYVYTLNNLPPSLAAVYAYINPIVAVLLGWMILDEHLNLTTALSCLVTLTGVYMVNTAVNKSKATYELS